MTFYETWLKRFNQTKISDVLYCVYLYNEAKQQYEKCLCSLECAIAYLETLATDFDFDPQKIIIKRGLEQVHSYADADGKITIKKWFHDTFRFAEYNGGLNSERYLIHFGVTAAKNVYLA